MSGLNWQDAWWVNEGCPVRMIFASSEQRTSPERWLTVPLQHDGPSSCLATGGEQTAGERPISRSMGVSACQRVVRWGRWTGEATLSAYLCNFCISLNCFGSTWPLTRRKAVCLRGPSTCMTLDTETSEVQVEWFCLCAGAAYRAVLGCRDGSVTADPDGNE